MSNVGQILGTARGTLPWRPEFGSELERLRHQNNTPVLRELVSIYVSEALSLWEPRVRLTNITVLPVGRGTENLIDIRASAHVAGAQSEQVFEFRSRDSSGRSPAADARLYSVNSSARTVRRIVGVDVGGGASAPLPKPMFVTGLVRPFVRGRDLKHGSGAEVILSNVGQILGTDLGTLPWRPELGSELNRLRHRQNTPVLREVARLCVEKAVTRWEPRANVRGVECFAERVGTSGENALVVRASCGISGLASGLAREFSVVLK
jgi:phage baseplate assembly protein W